MVRFKNRYYLLAVETGAQLEPPPPAASSASAAAAATAARARTAPGAAAPWKGKQLIKALRDAVLDLHGDFGYGSMQQTLSVKYNNPTTGAAIVRVNRDHSTMLTTTFPHVTAVGTTPTVLRVLHAAGTIRTCQRALLRHNRATLETMHKQCTTPTERAHIELLLAEAASVSL